MRRENLFHMNRFRGTGIHTGLAIYAHVLVDLGFVILHRNRRCRAFAHAGFTTSAFCYINNSYQTIHSIVIMRPKTKNMFRFVQVLTRITD